MTDKDYVWDIFIAHAEVDTEAAEALYEALLPHLRVFVDSRSVRIGESWEFEIPRAMNSAKLTVVMVGPETEMNVARGGLKARAFLAQIEAARTLCRMRPGGHLIVPFVLGRDVPEPLPFRLRRDPSVRNDEHPFLDAALQRLLTIDVATTPPPLDNSRVESKANLAAVNGEQLFAKKRTPPLVLIAVALLAILTSGVIVYVLLDDRAILSGLSRPADVEPSTTPVVVPGPQPAPASAGASAGKPEPLPAPAPAPVVAPAPAPVPEPVVAPAPASASPDDYFVMHKLKDGEFVGRVAKSYKADPKLTESYNPELNFNRLRPGTMIRIPKTGTPWRDVKAALGL